MAPGQVKVVEPHVRRIDAVGRLILCHMGVGVTGEELGVDDLGAPGTTHGEGIADHRPLRLTPQAEHLAQIVDQARQHHPIRLTGGANGFGRLHAVLDLRQVRVGIAFVH